MNKKTLITLLYICTAITQNWAQSAQATNSNTEVSTIQGPTVQKRDLTPEDYKLWEQITTRAISDNGAWYTCLLAKNPINGKYKERTLYLGSTKNATVYEFSFAGSGYFSKGSRWFTCFVREKGLMLLNLEEGTKQWLTGMTKFEFSSDGNYLLTLKKEANDSKASNLVILNLKNKKSDTILGVQSYIKRPNSNDLVYIQNTAGKKTVKLVTLGKTTSTTITENTQYPYKNLIWNTSGTALAFFQERPRVTETQNIVNIYCYKTIKGKSTVYNLDATTDGSIFPNKHILGSQLKFALKGTALYFKVHGPEDLETSIPNGEPDDVEVWRASDKELYPKNKGRQQSKTDGAKLAIWHPETGKTALLETNALPKVMVSNDGKYMLSYNPLLYAPSFAVTVNKDLHLINLERGTRDLFLKKYGGNIYFSPNSSYITYFKELNWWVYDLEKKMHTNITKNLPIKWHNETKEFPHKNGLRPYGASALGWTKDDKEWIVYDAYDVWLIAPTGKARRITQGRESKIRHRIYNRIHLYQNDPKRWEYIDDLGQEFDLSEGLVFETMGADKASGYSVWYPGKETKVLVYKDMRVNNLRKASYTDAYTYMEQSVNVSPRIGYLGKDGSDKIIKASNLQQKQFNWGNSELVHYKDPNGKALQGALLYPANYTLGKKYPMIVEIYEKLSMALHRYKNPTDFNRDRLNPTNYTTDGYFFFYPDIKHTLNEVGMSTLKSVESAVKAVIAKEVIDSNRIGLTGHSFGGYETNFIITQSNLFAAAVSGASVSDLVSEYHRISYQKSTMSRFEDWQLCFEDSFYDNPEVYLRNSPLHHAVNINTPLLLWAGKNDDTVDYRNSLALYLGLRRLNKTCELALYPGDGHNLSKPKNQIDRTRRIKAWFDKYLKHGDNKTNNEN